MATEFCNVCGEEQEIPDDAFAGDVFECEVPGCGGTITAADPRDDEDDGDRRYHEAVEDCFQDLDRPELPGERY